MENQETAGTDEVNTLIIQDDRSYVPPTTTYHRVEKVWSDNMNKAGERPKSIKAVLLQDGKPMEDKTAELCDANGWNYTWQELPLGHEYSAKEVTDLSDLGYESTVTSGQNKTVITNTYTGIKKTEAVIQGKKVLEGKELENGQFSFELRDENGNLTETVSNLADGSFAFQALRFTKKDAGKTYIYYVTEKQDAQEGISYDTSKFKVTIQVKEKGDGLAAEMFVEKDAAAAELVFTNRAEEITPTPSGKPDNTPTPTNTPTDKPDKTPTPTKTPDTTPKPTSTPSGGSGNTVQPTAVPNGYYGSQAQDYTGNYQTDTENRNPAKTADETNTTFYLFLLLVSGTAVIFSRRRQRKQ